MEVDGSKLRAAVLASTFATRTELRQALESARLATVVAESADYCTEDNWASAQEFRKKGTDIVLVEARGLVQTTEALRVIKQLLPQAWLAVVADSEDPHLLVECMRAGAREFLFKPVGAPQLRAALERYTEETAKGEAKEQGKLYCVTSAKGGSGATTLAINLAAIVSEAQYCKVALIDLDYPLGDAAPYLDLRPQFTVNDAVSAGSRLDTVLLSSYLAEAGNISVLPAPRDVQAQELSPEALARTLRVSMEAFSHVFVDLPNLFDERLLAAVTPLASEFLVVLTPELPALWRTRRLLSSLQQGGASDKVRIILNRTQSNDALNRKDIERTLAGEIFWSLPNDYKRSIEAVNHGKPLASLNHSSLSASYRELAQKLTGLSLVRKKRSILGIFNR